MDVGNCLLCSCKLQLFSAKTLIQVQRASNKIKLLQGVKLTYFSGSHLAPKYFKVVANSKTLVVIMTHIQTIFTLSLYQID